MEVNHTYRGFVELSISGNRIDYTIGGIPPTHYRGVDFDISDSVDGRKTKALRDKIDSMIEEKEAMLNEERSIVSHQEIMDTVTTLISWMTISVVSILGFIAILVYVIKAAQNG